MKKLTFIAFAAAALALAACQSEKRGPETAVSDPGQTTITATHELSTRSSLKADGDSYSILWDASDEILVAYAGVTPATFTSKSKKPVAEATFTGKLPEGSGTLYGIYPAVSGNAVDNDGMFSIAFKSEQTAVAGSYDPEAFPAVAATQSKNMSFQNVCGLLELKVGYDDVSSITLEPRIDAPIRDVALVGGYIPGGTLSVSLDDTPQIVECSETLEYIELLPPSGQEFFTKGTTYYMAVPPCSFPAGAQFRLLRPDGFMLFPIDNSVDVERSKVHKVPPFSLGNITYGVLLSECGNGKVEMLPDAPSEYEEFETVTVVATPDADYEIASVYYIAADSSTQVPLTAGSTEGQYTFEMPGANVVVYATFKAVGSGDDPGDDPAENDGTVEHPYTVNEALDLMDDLGVYDKNDASTYIDDVYVTGTIVSISEVSVEHGNATYNIATATNDGGSGSFIQVFRGRYLGNTMFTSEDLIETGDVVVVKGRLGNYKDSKDNITPEFMQGNYIYSLNGDSTAPAIYTYKIAVTTKPTKTSYMVGDTFDPAGMVVSAYKTDGTNEPVTGYSVSPTQLSTAGSVELTITWGNLSTTLTVTVIDSSAALGEYDSNVTWKLGSSCYDNVSLTVNGTEKVKNLKFGTGKLYGDATITLPAGTKKVTFYAASWNNSAATLKFTVGSKGYTFTPATNSGVSGNSFDISVSSSDKYTLTLDSALSAATDVKVETCAGDSATGYRAVLFGIQASE